MPRSFEAFAACLPGLEPWLEREVRDLGLDARPLAGGVAFTTDTAGVLRVGLRLGTASHVLLRVAQFRCRALGELLRKAKELPFGDWLRRDVAVEVAATTRGSRVYHTGAAVERVEQAIAAALGAAPRRRAHDDEPTARVHVRFRDDVCTISLDATSTPLHRRGWRLDGRKAPVREDLAHALVLASGWRPGTPLLDPFCGSGTIVIEAAGLALGLAPGRLRPPPLEHLAVFDAATWQKVLAEASTTHNLARSPAPIASADRDEGAAGATRANAERAGVAGAIEVTCGAFTSHAWFAPGAAPEGLAVVSNPPFGVRVADRNKLAPLYQTLGHRIAQLPESTPLAILAHDLRLARRTGIPLQAAFATRHGGLMVTALVRAAAAPPS
jgi:putative N6-adenine-specific DNA methylase